MTISLIRYPKHEVSVDALNRTVWVNSGEDGSCLARFDKRFGLDVHTSVTDQIKGKAQCLYCTHEPAGLEDWKMFIVQVKEHHGIEVDPNLLTF